MPKEIELKLQFSDGSLDTVLCRLRTLFKLDLTEPKTLVNIYYDTANLALNQHKIALRVRQKGQQFIQTLKTKGTSIDGLHQRGEWEWNILSKELDLSLLADCEAWTLDIDANELKKAFETNFDRYTAEIQHEGSRIELAIDTGDIIVSDNTDPINEIELELLEGHAEALISLGKLIKDNLSVEQYDVSKAERGYMLFKQTQGKS